MRALNLQGMRFGRYTVSARVPSDSPGTKWLCVCDCGSQKTVRGQVLTRGTTRSCGCLRREVSTARGRASKKHGHSAGGDSPTLRTWRAMVDRCTNPSDKSWDRYGGQGIKVCKSWLESFEAFLADMGTCPRGLTLERRNNNKGYDPENCYWTTRKKQANNRASNIRISINNEERTLTEWAEFHGLRPGLVHARLRRGWPIEKLFAPARPYAS